MKKIFTFIKKNTQAKLFLLFLFLIILAVGAYAIENRSNITQYISKAAGCSISTNKAEESILSDGKTSYVCNGASMKLCGGVYYCCKGTGGTWAKCTGCSVSDDRNGDSLLTDLSTNRIYACNKAYSQYCGGVDYCCSGAKATWSKCDNTLCNNVPLQGLYGLGKNNNTKEYICDGKKSAVCNGKTYCCEGYGKKWIGCAGDASCTQTKNTYGNFVLNNEDCNFPGESVECGGKIYCCPKAGEQWVVKTGSTCSSLGKPPADTPPKISGDGSGTGTGTSTGTGNDSTDTNPAKTKNTKNNKTTGACDDKGCSNIAQGSNWAINNCSGSDPDGDMQLCNAKGRIGTCGERQLCCPGPGQKWTTNMTACPITEASLIASPSSILAGLQLTVTWKGIPAPSTSDWLGMYLQGTTDERNPTEWNYVNSANTCTKTNGDGKSDGTCFFPLLPTVPAGVYELRLFSSDSYTKVAVSNLFTVTSTLTPTVSVAPTPPGGCCACPSPTPYFARSSCNNACMTSQNCPTGQVCLLAETYGWVCRNPACADTASCSCSTTSLTPTPRSQITKASCNQTCTTTSDCKTGYQCVHLNDRNTSVCRNPKCYTSSSCSCTSAKATITPTFIAKGTEITASESAATISGTPTPTGIRLDALPTPIPSPTAAPVNPSLTIKPFTDTTGKAPQKFTLTGTSDPFTEITIQFNPDAVGQTTTADAKGDWRYILTKSLSTGNKELTVTARSADGGETQVKQSFSVKATKSFFSLFVGFLFLALIGGVGFFIYQRQMNDQSNLFSQFPPIATPPEESGTDVTSTEPVIEEESKPVFPSSEAPVSTDNESPSTTISTDIPEEKPSVS